MLEEVSIHAFQCMHFLYMVSLHSDGRVERPETALYCTLWKEQVMRHWHEAKKKKKNQTVLKETSITRINNVLRAVFLNSYSIKKNPSNQNT